MEHNPTGTAGAAVFDRAAALAAVDGDFELLQELIELFLEDCPVVMQNVRDAVKIADADALQRAAHTLKGSVGVLAASSVMELAAELEELGRRGDLGPAPELVARLDAEFARLMQLLSELANG